ncbi:hypothetical protein Ae168Ps1_1925c [Pseudonocardia sp. Ae168_Ps1]|jgi:hypothetical protein|uniref:hypothetical protein n=1 Tax=unclassified Pseudonocardia TaxID=2619320 RepID=UPI0001FFEF70|nr:MULTISPECIES: hypothetical protein [unclassified Pseudonocardia]ALE72559.1 hypothetical protein FRP1_04535 [Pseudonocardia sp. EC080625-04]ALL75874.1 hypothetical protein AD006_12195 [Pseudonocardia sp. EC080610-09]ALL82901.1 hypothetical protein AD017_20020 [Pseudonocardia sp. EC080619-01]OLL73548.1 hypothetical protein Ae150APs1_1926c [Pseudonocardia sp. Ae150A_Ps1]OLL79519.1 hypothetical protein Ae168Ps1_1925c [Pseudonocardia sp. Ae168_Ps1]
MRRKLAVTGAAVVATLVAFSPLASAAPADEWDGDGDSFVQDVGNTRGDQFGLVNLDDVNVLNNANVCPGVNAAVGNVLGILGGGAAQNKGNPTSCD